MFRRGTDKGFALGGGFAAAKLLESSKDVAASCPLGSPPLASAQRPLSPIVPSPAAKCARGRDVSGSFFVFERFRACHPKKASNQSDHPKKKAKIL